MFDVFFITSGCAWYLLNLCHILSWHMTWYITIPDIFSSHLCLIPLWQWHINKAFQFPSTHLWNMLKRTDTRMQRKRLLIQPLRALGPIDQATPQPTGWLWNTALFSWRGLLKVVHCHKCHEFVLKLIIVNYLNLESLISYWNMRSKTGELKWNWSAFLRSLGSCHPNFGHPNCEAFQWDFQWSILRSFTCRHFQGDGFPGNQFRSGLVVADCFRTCFQGTTMQPGLLT